MLRATLTASFLGRRNTMYAIIETGGKQYKVSVGDTIQVEKLERAVGDKITFKPLLVADGDKITAGAPYVENVSVTAEVTEHGKGDKIVVFKYKAKKNERKKQGHRQPFTAIKIVEIK